MAGTSTPLSRTAALLVIDMQQAIDDPAWGRRGNPPGGGRGIGAVSGGR